jgi:hypothetical protein
MRETALYLVPVIHGKYVEIKNLNRPNHRGILPDEDLIDQSGLRMLLI